MRGTPGREDEADLREADRQACQLHFCTMKRLDIKLINAQSPYKVEAAVAQPAVRALVLCLQQESTLHIRETIFEDFKTLDII